MIVEASRISKTSLLVLLAVGVSIGSLIILLLLGILTDFVIGSATVSGEIEFGLPGVLDAILIWPIFSLLWVLFTWAFCILGLWVYTKWRPLRMKFDDATTSDSKIDAGGT